MNDFIKLLLSLSLSGTILIGMIVLFQRLLGDHFRKNWQYYIWLLVIARLLIPFSLDSSLMNQGFQQATTYVEAEMKPSNVSDSAYSNDAVTLTDSTPSVNNATSADSTTKSSILEEGIVTDRSASQTNAAPKKMISVKAILSMISLPLFILWLSIAVILFIRKVRTYCKFSKYLKEECTEITDLSHLELLGTTMERLSIQQPIRLYQNSNLSSPLLTGFFHCSVVLPNANLPEDELRCIFLHELTHFKKKDMFYKWLVQFTICVHWFNPAIYLISDLIEHSCELACDESVIENLDETEKKLYGDTLLHAAQASISEKNTLAGVALLESGKKLKERLYSIMNINKKTVFGICAMLILTVLVVISAIQIGSYHKNTQVAASPSEATVAAADSTSKDATVVNLAANNKVISTEVAKETTNESSEEASDHFYWNGTCYFMNSYYQNPYVFMIAWTDENTSKANSDTVVNLMMDDQTLLPVYFLDTNKDGANNTELLESLKNCLANVRTFVKSKRQNAESAVVMQYKKVDPDLEVTAKDSYEKGDYWVLEAISSHLSSAVQAEYLEQSYQDDEAGVFSTFSDCIGKAAITNGDDSAERKLINKYIEVSFKDDRIDMFSILEEYLTANQKKDYLEKAYQQDRIDFFSSYYDETDQQTIDDYALRSVKDDRIDFFGCLSDEVSDDIISTVAKNSFDNDQIDFFSCCLYDLDQSTKVDYAAKAYQQDRIDFFSCLMSELSQEQLDNYLAKAKKDKRNDFYYTLLNSGYCYEEAADDDY